MADQINRTILTDDECERFIGVANAMRRARIHWDLEHGIENPPHPRVQLYSTAEFLCRVIGTLGRRQPNLEDSRTVLHCIRHLDLTIWGEPENEA